MGGEMTDLAAIRARVAAATPGPWEAAVCRQSVFDGSDWCGVAPVPLQGTRWGVCLTGRMGAPEEGQSIADAELIAHAPTDLLALCAEVERLRAEVAASERRGAERALRWAWNAGPDHENEDAGVAAGLAALGAEGV